ncbi:hypothetical protein ABTF34_03935 [Acinetobacter baumannii]|uniref:hypothetical protein n=1 Tax=Acinetobacter baumannii TaxID=470 RepID=UPI0026FDBA02|nr:hypothetical protein [Acinetobacter baumannii]HCE1006785.1 hypothetical protein [Acinetobacter baumannii]
MNDQVFQLQIIINGGYSPIQYKAENLDKLVKEFAINHMLFPKEVTEQLIEINAEDNTQTKKVTKVIDLVSSNQQCSYQIRKDALIFVYSFKDIEELEAAFNKFFESFTPLTSHINFKQSKRLGLVLVKEEYNDSSLQRYCEQEKLERGVIENRTRKVTRFAMGALNEMVNFSVSKEYLTQDSGAPRNTLANVFDVNTLSTKDVFRFSSKDVVKFIDASKQIILDSM